MYTRAEMVEHGKAYCHQVARLSGVGATRKFTTTHQGIVDTTAVIEPTEAVRQPASPMILISPPPARIADFVGSTPTAFGSG